MLTYHPVDEASHLTATATATANTTATNLSYQDTFPFAENCAPVPMCQ